MSDGGKGSSRRPKAVTDLEYATRWDAIFGRDEQPEPKPMAGLHEPTIDDAMKALSHNDLDAAWHTLRVIKNQTAYWRERAMQAEAELHALRGHK